MFLLTTYWQNRLCWQMHKLFVIVGDLVSVYIMEIVDIQASVVQVYLAWLRQRVQYLSCC